MNRYLAKLQQIDPEAKLADGFVSFVSAPSSPNFEFQNSKNATDVNRQNCQNPYGRVFEELRSGCPALVEVERWQKTIRDAQSFLATWGGQAYALGWTARELFGLHPVPAHPAPAFRRLSRYDSTGLIWLLQGRPVIALTETEAAIQSAGAVVVYRKHRKPALGPLGDCLDDMELRP
jgi:hypothetical protein